MKKKIEEKKSKLVLFIEWIIYIFSYSLLLLLMSILFKSFTIDYSYFGLYAILAVIIIYLLNLTVKPIIVFLTLPITGLTLGLFYPFINVFILKLTEWILRSHFEISNLVVAFFIAIIISFLNVLIDEIIIKPIVRRLKYNG